jgi:Transposase zinc-binding domain
MARPVLEVADIFRDHGPAWREANRGHVSLDQSKVMSAIERCRTAALGGHVARCENAACGHTEIAYNSCRTARARPATAAGYRHGHAPCAALPLSALWRPHDRDRGVRTRLRAEVASDDQQDRHIMSQTALERRDFLVPMRWPRAGSDLSRPGHCPRRTGRSLIRSERLPKCMLRASNLAGVQMRRPHPVGVTSTLQLGATIKSP